MNAIDFAKITKTVDGLDCYYLGPRKSGGKVIHRFAIVNDASEVICYYDEHGKRLDFSGAGGWVVCKTGGHQIIAPPKIVEVTRWVALYPNEKGGYWLDSYTERPSDEVGWLSIQQHTFRFEVPQ